MAEDPLGKMSTAELREAVEKLNAIIEARTEAELGPYVAIGTGERAPWANEPLTCPTCGKKDLPLLESVPPGLSFINHCGQSWLRGDINFEQLTNPS